MNLDKETIYQKRRRYFFFPNSTRIMLAKVAPVNKWYLMPTGVMECHFVQSISPNVEPFKYQYMMDSIIVIEGQFIVQFV